MALIKQYDAYTHTPIAIEKKRSNYSPSHALTFLLISLEVNEEQMLTSKKGDKE